MSPTTCSTAEAEPADKSNSTQQNRPRGDVPSCSLTQKPLWLKDVILEREVWVSPARILTSSSRDFLMNAPLIFKDTQGATAPSLTSTTAPAQAGSGDGVAHNNRRVITWLGWTISYEKVVSWNAGRFQENNEWIHQTLLSWGIFPGELIRYT